MKPAGCAAPIDLPTLLAHWLGELNDAEDARVGEHLLGCGPCTAQAQWIADVAAGMRAIVSEGAVRTVVSNEFLARAAASGLRLREYRVPAEGSVNCTIAPDDDLLITRLAAPLAGAERVDLLMLTPSGEVEHHLADVPFDPALGVVIFTSRTADIRALPGVSFQMRLLAVGPGGERPIGTYRFNHSPWTAKA